MTQQLVIRAHGLPAPELDSLVEGAAAGTEVSVLPADDAEAERQIDPEVVIAVVQAVTTVLVPFITAFAARLFKKEPDAKLEVKQPADQGAAAPTVTVIVATQSPEEREQLLAQYLPAAANVEVVLPE